MRLWLLVLLVLSTLLACSRSEGPAPSSSPTTVARVTAAPPAKSPAVARAAATPAAARTAEDEDLDEDDNEDEPLGPEFEIDASASSYSGYVPKTIAFVARPLNGTPPFTYDWDFGDGSEHAQGFYVVHRFTKTGTVNVFVTSRDGNGETSRVQLGLVLLTPEEFAQRRGVDPATLPSETPRDYLTPTPEPLVSPAATPKAGSTE